MNRSFIVIGENIHTTRILRRPSPRIVDRSRTGRRSRSSTSTASRGSFRSPRRSSERRSTQKGASSTSAAPSAWLGADDPIGVDYLRRLALEQIDAGAAFLDVNVDEYSHRLPEQIETME